MHMLYIHINAHTYSKIRRSGNSWDFFFSYDDMICGALIVARARAGCCDAAAWAAPRSAGLSAAVSLLLSRLSPPRYPKAMKPPIKPPPSEMPTRRIES